MFTYLNIHFRYFFIVLLFGFLSSFAHADTISKGADWLSLQINSGELSDTDTHALALAYQSSAQSVSAMTLLDSISRLDTQMLLVPFEQSNKQYTTEYLSANIYTYKAYDLDISDSLKKLLGLQNGDGGFGHHLHHTSTTLDTATALETLMLVPEKRDAAAKAIGYLVSKQKPDGSWQDSEGQNLYTTAKALHALWLYRKSFNLAETITKAEMFLRSQKKSDGSYGDELFESAIALRALAPLTYDKSNIEDTITYLKNTQHTDGSWDEDIYTTALALQALYVADRNVPNPDLATIRGVVVDGDTDVALSDIRVVLDNGSDMMTQQDGAFRFEGLKNGTYTLDILSDHYAPLHTSIRLMGDDVDLGSLRLSRDVNASISVLKGIIKDRKTSLPLSNVKIMLDNREVYTDSNGNYILDSIEAGTYTIQVSKAGYAHKQQSINIPANTIMHYNLLLDSIDFSVEAIVNGKVVDANTSLALSDVTVTLSGAKTSTIQTGSDGVFSFSHLGIGEYKIVISKTGYRSVSAKFSVKNTGIIDYGNVALEVLKPSDTGVTVRGTVNDAVVNTPIEGVIIKAGTKQAVTDSNGSYEIRDLQAGALHLEAIKEGYGTKIADINASEGAVLIFSPSLSRNDANLSIYGTVIDANSSKPLAYVKVEYTGDSNITVYTNAKGHYVVPNVQSGNALLRYSKVGYEDVGFDVHINNQSLNISPRMHATIQNTGENDATITGYVHDLISLKALNNVSLEVRGIHTNTHLTTDQNGYFELNHIVDNDINITFAKENYKDTNISLVLNHNETVDLGSLAMRPLSNKLFIPDLKIENADFSQTSITADDLIFSGIVKLTVANIGGVPTDHGFNVLAFYDVDRDGNYTDTVDIKLGNTSIDQIIDVDANLTLNISVSGRLPFVNAPISFWVDSKTDIIEIDENNNLYAYNQKCGNVSSVTTTNIHAQRVKKAIEDGSDYIAPTTIGWDKSKRCLGCHIQTQTLVGLQGSMAKANVDTEAGDYLLSRIINAQHDNGTIYDRHSYWLTTQTSLSLWSLSYVPDINRTFNVRAKALKYLETKKYIRNNNEVYWIPDYSGGWFNSANAITSIISFSASIYLRDALNEHNLTILEQETVDKYKAMMPKIANYFYSESENISTNNIQIALQIIGLAEANKHIDNNLTRSAEINARIGKLVDILRERQNKDGGWSYRTSGSVSDPLTSAWVGLALNYKRFAQNDKIILRNIDYLLNTQQSNGSWVTNSGLFSTRLSTTGLIMAYLPVALDYLDSSDLSVSLLRLDENSDGTLDLHARIGNGGSDKLRTASDIVFYDGDPDQGGSKIAYRTLKNLNKWEYRDIVIHDIGRPQFSNIYAVVDSQDWIHECNELNNFMQIPVSASKLYAIVQVSTNKPSYTNNEVVTFSAISTNLGKLDANLTAQLILEDTSGNIIQSFDPQPLGVLASGEDKTITNEWNTTDTLVGTYIVRGVLTDSKGVVVDESTGSFEIVSDAAAHGVADLALMTDRVRYRTTDIVTITNLAANISENTAIDNAKVILHIKNSKGVTVKEEVLRIGDMLPRTQRDIGTAYEYRYAKEGDYELESALYDGGGTLLATAHKTITLYEDMNETLKGSVKVQWRSAPSGTTQTCTYSLTYFGAHASENRRYTVRLVDLDNGMLKDEYTDTASLQPLHSYEKVRRFDTSALRAKRLTCALYAKENGAWVLLDHQPFKLTNTPPVARHDRVSTDENTPVLIDVLDNDFDLESTLGRNNIRIITPPAHGHIVITGDKISYLPQPNYSGADSFVYRLVDNEGLVSADARVNIVIDNTNEPPIALGQNVTTVKNRYREILLSGEDPDGDALHYSIVSQPIHGSLSGTAPSVLYLPNVDFTGRDYFAFKVNDGAVDSGVAIVHIDVREDDDTQNSGGCGCQCTCGCQNHTDKPHAPDHLSISFDGTQGALLTWRDRSDNELFFVVYLNGKAIGVVKANQTRYRLNDLVPGMAYEVYVRVYGEHATADSKTLRWRMQHIGWLPAIYFMLNN